MCAAAVLWDNRATTGPGLACGCEKIQDRLRESRHFPRMQGLFEANLQCHSTAKVCFGPIEHLKDFR